MGTGVGGPAVLTAVTFAIIPAWPLSSCTSSVTSTQSPTLKLRSSSGPRLTTLRMLPDDGLFIAVTPVATLPLSRDHLNSRFVASCTCRRYRRLSTPW